MKATKGVMFSNGTFIRFNNENQIVYITNNENIVYCGTLIDLDDEELIIYTEEYGQIELDINDIKDIKLLYDR